MNFPFPPYDFFGCLASGFLIVSDFQVAYWSLPPKDMI
jgi:hypothetical protein